MTTSLRTDHEGRKIATVTDAIGNGLNIEISLERGIVDLTLVNANSGNVVGSSACVELDDLRAALRKLARDDSLACAVCSRVHDPAVRCDRVPA